MATSARVAQAEARPAARPAGGVLVTLEGIDGSGKSTLAEALHARLRDRGVAAVLTREPTRTWQGEAVRRAVREGAGPFVEAFLFLADHAAHVRQVERWLLDGKVVVSDRYGDSFLAYQAASLRPALEARGIPPLDWLTTAQAPVTRPADVCLLVDLAPEAALARIAARPERERFEDAGFLAEVRANYLELAKRRGFVVLDGEAGPADLLAQAWLALQRRGVAPP